MFSEQAELLETSQQQTQVHSACLVTAFSSSSRTAGDPNPKVCLYIELHNMRQSCISCICKEKEVAQSFLRNGFWGHRASFNVDSRLSSWTASNICQAKGKKRKRGKSDVMRQWHGHHPAPKLIWDLTYGQRRICKSSGLSLSRASCSACKQNILGDGAVDDVGGLSLLGRARTGQT